MQSDAVIFSETMSDDYDDIDEGGIDDTDYGCGSMPPPTLTPLLHRCLVERDGPAPAPGPLPPPPPISLRATYEVFSWGGPRQFGKPWEPPPASCNFALPAEVLQMLRGAPY